MSNQEGLARIKKQIDRWFANIKTFMGIYRRSTEMKTTLLTEDILKLRVDGILCDINKKVSIMMRKKWKVAFRRRLAS